MINLEKLQKGTRIEYGLYQNAIYIETVGMYVFIETEDGDRKKINRTLFEKNVKIL